ncbi:MAG: hypothetical protein HN738_00075 [Gammaproteobacteria bacterium]|jgi:hypothetical protein|nr:hypothetical protein [Gammaproteobacteria bacterium]MBT5724382.1 hypothetical protein [Gammaproteobacteria bacterium]MBT6893124.1 hypothetical protein [Gammaproteobacteria bacterium]MBT7876453.1 hypothetical protein [Gammaproteobacteria bacterium]
MILSVFMFFIGIHFMIMLLAACYRSIDLWYRIGDFWQGILARIAGLTLLNGILLSTLSGNALNGFAWGQLCYLVFHIVIFWAAQIAISLIETRRR